MKPVTPSATPPPLAGSGRAEAARVTGCVSLVAPEASEGLRDRGDAEPVDLAPPDPREPPDDDDFDAGMSALLSVGRSAERTQKALSGS
jgi:hypothetical protein